MSTADDMFVDCPDEIENSESQQSSEEKDNLLDNHFEEVDSGIKVQNLMTEIELLRDMNDKSVTEKDRLAREYEEERAEFTKEILHFRHQLKVFNEEKFSPIENSDGYADWDEKGSLREVISECSKFLENALDKRSVTEQKVKELEYLLSTKDQEIEILNANLAQSNSSSNQEILSQIEGIANGILTSLSVASHQEAFLEGSLEEKFSNIESSVSYLAEKYNTFVSETDQLRACLAELGSDLDTVDETGTIAVARDKFLELSEKEENSRRSIIRLEDENRKLLDQIENSRKEIEQEKHRYANTKEKLGMAVTKGKALVQQRDSLKQALAEKTSQLEKCSIELQEKEAALQKCGEVLEFEELQGTDTLEKLGHLVESFHLSKEEAAKLQFEIVKTKEDANGEIERLTESILAETEEKNYILAELEDSRSKFEAHEASTGAAKNEIDRLSASLLAGSQEKNYLESELENLRGKYEEIVQKENHVSLEKDRIVSMLLEACGIENDGHEEILKEYSDMTALVNSILGKIKDKTPPTNLDVEASGSIQSLLYVQNQEMTLYKLILDEDTMDRAEVIRLSNELSTITREFVALKDEKVILQKNFEQLEEKCALLREKLTMAVKKGKGLVQERENTKSALNEKNIEIDRLKSELQENLSKYDESQDQIKKLETDLFTTRERADQFEQFLAESNSMLQRVMESIEGITSPNDLIFEDPVEKVKWVTGYLKEHEITKIEMEQELRKVKEEESSLASKFSETQTVINSLKDSLSMAESKISLLEEELQKEKDEAFTSKRLLEDAMSVAESNSALAEEQLWKLKEEFSASDSKLADRDKTIESLELELSRAKENLSQLVEENSKVQIGRGDLDIEIEKIRIEYDSASRTIKSLEDALSNSENKISDLEHEISTLNLKLKSCDEELAGTHGSKENLVLEISGRLRNLESVLKDETLFSLVEEIFLQKTEGLKNVDLVLQEMMDGFLEIDPDVLPNGHVTKDDTSISTTLPPTLDGTSSMEPLKDVANEVDSKSIIFHVEQMIENFHKKDKLLADKFDIFSSYMDESITDLSRKLHKTRDRTGLIINRIKSLKQQVEDTETDRQRQEDTVASLESVIKNATRELVEPDNRLDLDTENLSIEENLLHAVRYSRDLREKFHNAMNKLTEDSEKKLKETELYSQEILEERDLNKDTIFKLESDLEALQKLCQEMELKLNEHKLTEDLEKKLKETELYSQEILEERDLYKDKIFKLESDLEALQKSCQEMELNLDEYKLTEGFEKKLKETELYSEEILKERDLYKDKTFKLESDLEDLQKSCQEMELKLDEYKSTEDFEKKLKETELYSQEILEERDLYKDKTFKLESDLEALKRSCQEMELKLDEHKTAEDIEKKLKETELYSQEISEERDLYKDKSFRLESDLKALQSSCQEMGLILEDYKEKDERLSKQESELSTSLSKAREFEDSQLSPSQIKSILHKINEIELPDDTPFPAAEEDQNSTNLTKLIYVIDSFIKSAHEINSLSHEKEELQSAIGKYVLEKKDLEKMMKEFSELESGLRDIFRKMGGNNDLTGDEKVPGAMWILPFLDRLATEKMLESENLKSKNEELGVKFHGAQKVVDELSNKVKFLEDSRIAHKTDQERGTSIASLPTQSEISEIQDMGAIGKLSNVALVPSAAHVRTMRKGSSDHLAISIDSESERLMNSTESDEDKGHMFKSLNTSGLIPVQGRTVADRIDGYWVTGSRALMSRPRGRLGLVAYWLVLHIWLFATIF